MWTVHGPGRSSIVSGRRVLSVNHLYLRLLKSLYLMDLWSRTEVTDVYLMATSMTTFNPVGLLTGKVTLKKWYSTITITIIDDVYNKCRFKSLTY